MSTTAHIFRRLLRLYCCLFSLVRLTQHMMTIADFDEGVRALLIDKDKQPAWSPPTLEGVSEAAVEALFAEIRHGNTVF